MVISGGYLDSSKLNNIQAITLLYLIEIPAIAAFIYMLNLIWKIVSV